MRCASFLVASASILLLGCSGQNPSTPIAPSTAAVAANGAAPSTAGGARRDVTQVFWLSNRTTVPGSAATLVRNASGVTMTLQTSGLPAGAYTTWWVIFNNPAACSNGVCGEDDLPAFGGAPAVNASVVFATGHVVSENGTANFGAWLGVGETDGALFGPGLVNVYGAEIHNVVRSHGEVLPAFMPSQISSFNGGCPAGTPPGPNSCFNVQGAIHKP